jgi:transcription-repair coupling factor (superfamily II helicase)
VGVELYMQMLREVVADIRDRPELQVRKEITEYDPDLKAEA